ncbi:MAG: protein kinase [Micromonosporaceae bacterium]|nr:protein kinase [Micromonosporaceae bacterium]
MEDELSAGDLLARRYRLIDRIGAGGMSVIWRARDEVLDRMVALKVLTHELAADQRYRDLVREEARNAAQLVHPNVTAVHDYGEEIAPDGRITAFVVMELLAGESLQRRLTAGALPWPQALEICAQVAEALAAAHRIGVVHRDITPANIMLTDAGVKVLDFGIATRVGAPDEDEDGETFGTPAYVAPERLDGMPAQPATDTYALGVLLYETLTGRVPFPALSWDDVARTPRHGQPPAPTSVPGLPPAVAEICRSCLHRSPLDRPTAHQVAVLLRANIPGQGEVAQPQVPACGKPSVPQVPAAETPSAPAAATPYVPAAEKPSVPAAPALPDLSAGVIGLPGVPSSGPGARPTQAGQATFLPGSAPADPAGAAVPTRTISAQQRHRDGTGPRVRWRDRTWVRVTVATTAAVAVFAAAGVLASTLGRPGTVPDDGALAPATLTPAGPAASGSPSANQPAPTASAEPDRTTPPSPNQRPPTVAETIAAISQIIDAGVQSKEIRSDAAVDLRNVIENLREAIRRGVADLAQEAANLQDKVAAREREGAITGTSAQRLEAELARLGRL